MTPYTVIVEQPADEPPVEPSPAPPAPPAVVAAPVASGAPTGSGPRIPHIVEWLDVPEYPGFRARCWINPTRRLAGELNSGDVARVRAVLRELVLEHNGWCDDEGHPLPPAQEDGFWDELGVHLLGCLIAAIAERASRNPLARTRSTS